MDELDAITLGRARSGDAAALSALVRTYGGSVHALSCRMLAGCPGAVAEDLCQEALVKWQNQQLQAQKQQLQAQKQQLESTLEVLQNQLKDARSHSSRHKILGLDQKELEAMARRCELRWDLPPVGTSPPRVDGEAARALGLSDAERATMNKVFSEFNGKLMQELRGLYVEVTGDAKTAGGLSPY